MNVQRCSTLFQLICLAIFLGCAQAKFGAFMTKIECLNYVPEVIKHLKCWVNRTSPSTGTFSMEISFTKDINEAIGNYTISQRQGSSIRQYISLQIDFCKALSSIQSNYAVKIIRSELHRSSNFPLECPAKKEKLYYIYDFALDTRALPSYVPEMDFISNATMNYNKKKALQVIVYGRLVRDKIK